MPDHAGTVYAILTDKETHHDQRRDRPPAAGASVRDASVCIASGSSIACSPSMLSARLAELAQKPDAPVPLGVRRAAARFIGADEGQRVARRPGEGRRRRARLEAPCSPKPSGWRGSASPRPSSTARSRPCCAPASGASRRKTTRTSASRADEYVRNFLVRAKRCRLDDEHALAPALRARDHARRSERRWRKELVRRKPIALVSSARPRRRAWRCRTRPRSRRSEYAAAVKTQRDAHRLRRHGRHAAAPRHRADTRRRS